MTKTSQDNRSTERKYLKPNCDGGQDLIKNY